MEEDGDGGGPVLGGELPVDLGGEARVPVDVLFPRAVPLRLEGVEDGGIGGGEALPEGGDEACPPWDLGRPSEENGSCRVEWLLFQVIGRDDLEDGR